MIAEYLEKEFQVTLSLSCRQLRLLLGSHLDLSLRYDTSAKLQFLQCLEPDYPEYLTCRPCGAMFKWRDQEYMNYQCPRLFHHADWTSSTSQAWLIQGLWTLRVTREMVDLIFRAHEGGQQYGLPLSFLNISKTDDNGITQSNEARLVDGQLIVASRWEVDVESRQEISCKAQCFNSALCLHFFENVYDEKICQLVDVAFIRMIDSKKSAIPVTKCPFCECDYELRVQSGTDSRMRVILNVWRNYGRRYGNTLGSEQIFLLNPLSRIDPVELSRRDLHAAFESARTADSAA